MTFWRRFYYLVTIPTLRRPLSLFEVQRHLVCAPVKYFVESTPKTHASNSHKTFHRMQSYRNYDSNTCVWQKPLVVGYRNRLRQWISMFKKNMVIITVMFLMFIIIYHSLPSRRTLFSFFETPFGHSWLPFSHRNVLVCRLQSSCCFFFNVGDGFNLFVFWHFNVANSVV